MYKYFCCPNFLSYEGTSDGCSYNCPKFFHTCTHLCNYFCCPNFLCYEGIGDGCSYDCPKFLHICTYIIIIFVVPTFFVMKGQVMDSHMIVPNFFIYVHIQLFFCPNFPMFIKKHLECLQIQYINPNRVSRCETRFAEHIGICI